MNKMIRHSVIAVAVLAAMSPPTAHAVNLCVGKGIAVGFNGVWNTQYQTEKGLAELI